MEERDRNVVALKVKQAGSGSLENGLFYSQFRIVETFRDDIGLHDTIVLIGGNDGAACQTGFSIHYQHGGFIFMLADYNLEDPADYFSEFEANKNYFFPGLCSITTLSIDDDDYVTGLIDWRIFEYPVEFFEDDLIKCEFSEDSLNEYIFTNTVLYPNPLNEGNLNINFRASSRVNRIEIFDNYGNLLKLIDKPFNQKTIDVSDLSPQVLNLVLYCEEKRIVRRIVKL